MSTILLDRNENQYGPAPACYEVLRRANLEQLSLYSRSYTHGTKGELAERLSADFGIPERRLLLGYGSEDLLKQVVHCYLHAGESILMPAQSWWYYRELASETGGRHIAYSLQERGDTFAYDIDEIVSLYDRHRPSIILIASPNNPTGNSIADDQLDALVNHCASSIVVLDEAYHGFGLSTGDNSRRLARTCERIVLLRTFSKYYALAGLRIGFACVGTGVDRLIGFSARYLGYNRLSEQIALAALDQPDYYRTMARLMDEDKESSLRSIARFENYTPFRSDANFMLVRYPAPERARLEEGFARRDIRLRFLTDPGLSDCLRITIGTREQNRAVLAAFEEIAVTAPVPATQTVR